MPLSGWIDLVHWIVYLGSIAAFVALLSRWRPYAALWIAFLFGSQAVFHGCVLISWQNQARLLEHRAPFADPLLMSAFTSDSRAQVLLSVFFALCAFSLAAGDLLQRRFVHRHSLAPR